MPSRKKLKPGTVAVADDENALVVHYEVQVTETDEAGAVLKKERTPGQKRVRVKALTAGSDVPSLALKVVESCKFLAESQLGAVEDALRAMQRRELGGGVGAIKSSKRDSEALRERFDLGDMGGNGAGISDSDPASIRNIDDYLEALYDELPAKVVATAKLAQLSRRVEHLEELITHDSLLGALSRVLKEDGKRSVDLCTNIISVFFSLSNFSQFHPSISEHGMGAKAIEIVDLEVKRAELREKEHPDFAQVARKMAEGKVLSDQQTKMMAVVRKQDQLLYLCFYLLLNLAEDPAVERKMKKKNIVVYLVKMLDRHNVELLILSVTFLKKLSIYKENKEKMAECLVVEKLTKFVPCRNEALLIQTLRLLYNLSFDPTLRDVMAKNGLIPTLVELIKAPPYQQVSLSVLYHLSMSDEHKTLFTYTDAVAMIKSMLVQDGDLREVPEVIALAVNLTMSARIAEVMCGDGGAEGIAKAAMRNNDSLRFKVVRNLTQNEIGIKRRFKSFIKDFVAIVKDENTPSDVLVEVLGTLGNLTIPEFGFLELVREHDLLSFLAQHIRSGAEDDIVLECVIFAGTICDATTAPLIRVSGLCQDLYRLMSEKKEEDEMVLQIAYAFRRMLPYEDTRTCLLEETQAVMYLIDLLQDKNPTICKTASECVDVVLDYADVEMAERVRRLRFESFNQEWLEVVLSDMGPESPVKLDNRQRYMRGVDMDDMADEEDDVDGVAAGEMMRAESRGGWGRNVMWSGTDAADLSFEEDAIDDSFKINADQYQY